MGLFGFIVDALIGNTFSKGSHPVDQNEKRHRAYKDNWVSQKKASGQWLSKEEYQRRTGKPGRK
jgi:hypothetical protein